MADTTIREAVDALVKTLDRKLRELFNRSELPHEIYHRWVECRDDILSSNSPLQMSLTKEMRDREVRRVADEQLRASGRL